MEGVLDPLMRKLITEVSNVDCCTTEFIRVTDKVLPKHVFYKYAPELQNNCKTESGTPVMVQLLGGKPEWLALNALEAKNVGAYGIDLNFGCPAKTVNRHDGGASLLKTPQRLYNTITAVKNAVGENFHVSAKVRLGFSDTSQILEISEACSKASASWITVHARTKEDGYKPPAHWHLIKKMKSVSKIPFLANGDIWSLEDYKRCKTESGCENVMIGRGLMRNPFLSEEIKTNTEIEQNTKDQKLLKLIIKYIKLSQSLYGSVITLGRTKQWLRMAHHPENIFIKNCYTSVRTITKTQVALDTLKSKLNGDIQ